MGALINVMLVLLLPFGAGNSSVTVESWDSSGITVVFQTGDIQWDEAIRLPGEGLMAEPGMPDLPAARRMIQVPATGRIEVEIIHRESQIVSLDGMVEPFQPLPIRGEDRRERVLNGEFYSGSETWPASPVILESVEILRDIRIARAAFAPVRWNPETGELEVTTSVTARFYATDETGENELQRIPAGVTASFEPFYREVVGYTGAGEPVSGSYLVISTEDGIDTVADLLEWKFRKGFEVIIGVIPDIGSTSSAIDEYIENAFNTWPNPPEYVLLVGDADMVPSPSYNGHSADNLYGVIGSGCVPSIHVGRLTGENSLDLQYEAWKIMQHEIDPYQVGGSWFQKGISVGHTEFVNNSWDYMEYMMAAGMDPIWFCETGGITPTVAALSDSLNAGASILGLCGHGDVSTIYPPGFDIDDVAALDNGRKLAWFALVACQVGMFEGNYCFCEALMGEGSIAEPRGAIGAMGPTTNSPYGAADSLVKWIFKGYFQEEVRHMGAVTDWSKNEVYLYYGSSAVDNNHMHMLFGCPEMDIYYDTAPLAQLMCDHPDPIYPGQVNLTVTADGVPVEGALVAIRIDDPSSGDWMESGYTDASGNASINVTEFTVSSNIYVTATSFNMAPYHYQSISSGGGSSGAVSGALSMSIGSSPCTGLLSLHCNVPGSTGAVISVFDLTGRLVRDLPVGGGAETVVWDRRDAGGRTVSNGIYYCRLSEAGRSVVRPVLLL